jgi:gliding motility-associated-like protein
MRSLKITLFCVFAFNSLLLKAQYTQNFEPISGSSATIITVLRNQCWNIDGLSINAGGSTPIDGAQSFVTGTAANLANRGFITPYMTFDGSDSVAINYKYYGTPGNFQRWFLLKIISDIGQITTIDSVFINTSVNSVINFNKNINGFTGKFKIFINYRGSGNGIVGSRTGFDNFFFSGNYFYPTGCTDTDFDGVVDTKDVDDDNDGISDFVEVCGLGATNFSCLGSTPASSDPARDADGDGVVNFLDPQFCTLNSNGICNNLDFDGDGIPNHLDLDSDNDGVLDALEANNGIAPTNYSNGIINSPVGPNGMPNSAETATNTGISNFPLTNTDGQSRPDFLDIDADNDGIVDNIEAQGTFTYIAPLGIDTDRDGVDDAYDNQNGLLATGLTPVNTDNSDSPDYTDGDADNDSRNDIIEAFDNNGNNIQDGTELAFTISGNDSDNDGLDNNYDLVIGFNVTNGGQNANSFPNAQLGTAERDWREIPFIPEICNNGIDDDGDGFADCLDTDCGIPTINSLTITNAGPCTNIANGNIVIHAGNALLYSIDNGINFSIDSVFNNLAAGFYNIVVQNSNGCTASNNTNPVEITSSNCAPIALDDNYNTNQNTVLNGSTIIANDNSTDGPQLIINTIAITVPSNGSLIINNDGSFIYTPNSGFFGNDSFEYLICDGASPELCDTGLVSIIVNQVNQLPVINNESFTTNLNTQISGNILLNDSDPDGTLGVTTTAILNPLNGVFSTDTTGNFTYTPNTGFVGTDTIVVLVCDNNGACLNDTLFITTISNINPVVVNESLITNEDNNISGNILLNDSDADGTLNATLAPVLNPSNGIFNITANGDFNYSPNLNYNGTDTIIIAVCDNLGACINDTIFITISPVNDLPVIVNENIVVQINTPFNGNILINDSDVEGPLTTSTTPLFGPLNGVVNMSSNGSFTYTPNNGFQGIDLMWFQVCDTDGACSNDTIFVIVTNQNLPPTVINESIVTNEDTPISGNILTNDTDLDGTISVNITPVQTASNGVVIMNLNGDFTYTPDPNFFGTDLAIFEVCDNSSVCINDTIFITVNAINDLPVIVNDIYTINQNQTLIDNILLNDIDIESALNATILPLINSSNGSITMQTNGDFIYIPNNNFNGVDTAVFTVCDTDGACINDTIIITILPINNQTPIVVNDFYTLQENSSINNNFTINDTDPDGFLIITLIPTVNVAHGSLSYNNLGVFTYTPNTGFVGLDTAVIQICDNNGVCILDTLFFNITPLSNLPIVLNDFFTLNEDATLNDNFLTNDISNLGAFTTSIVSGATHGNFTLLSNGFFDYTPNLNYHGTDTVIVLVCDVNSICINDTIFFTVLPVIDPIVINNEIYNTTPNTSFSDNILTNDIDIDGTLSVTLPQIFGPVNGNISINTDGSFTYTPNNGFTGNDTIITLVCSTAGTCENDTMVIQVQIFNNPPVVNNEIFNTTQDQVFVGNILSNDFDLESFLIANVTPIVDLTNGVITMFANGAFNYVPNAGFIGNDFAVFSVCDLDGACVNDTVFFIVNPIPNINPDVFNDFYTVVQNGSISDNLMLNDSDPDGTISTNTTPIVGPANGVIFIQSNGDFTYIPNQTFIGNDTVVVLVCDNSLACVNDTLFFSVTGNNTPPIVQNESFTTNINIALSGNILINDSDAEGPLSVSISPIYGPINGTVIINSNGDFTYTPNFNFSGLDTIVVKVCDNNNVCINDTIFITIPAGNTFPVVQNETYNATQDQVFVGNILTNDFDLESVINVNVTPIVDLTNGVITMFANGAFNYVPNAGFIGNDFAVFSVCDLDGACVNDTVFFIVNPIPNINPDVFNDFYTVVQDGSISDNLMLNDSDPDGIISTNTTPIVAPANGIITVQLNGDFTYTPNIGFIGNDTVVVQVCDNSLACVNDTLFFTVNPINNLPIVQNDTITIQEDNNAIGNILLNDSDPDGPVTASLTVVLNPAHGTVIIDASGNYAYSPNNNYNGNDTIVFSVCDSDNNCINDTLFVTVLPINDDIIVANENLSTNENTPLSGNIVSNDADPDGTNIVVNTTAILLPANGTVLINSNGTFDYLPNLGFIGVDTFVVNICDSGTPLPASCLNDTIFITVIDINNPPIVFNENVITDEDIAISGTVITTDNDPDGTALTTDTVPVSGPFNGIIAINPNGNFTYTPNNNFNGVDTIIVQICDSGLPLPAACSLDTIFVTINAINDAPLITNDTISTFSNQSVNGNILLNDTDIENTTLTADSINFTGPANGTFTINTNGDFVYTPNTGFYGQDTVIIHVCDSGIPLPVNCVNDTLIININPIPAIANAGADQTICSNSIVLTGNATPVGNGLWTVISGNAIFADSSIYNTIANNLAIGQNILTWSISSNSGTTTDTVVINVVTPLAQPNAGADKIICSFSDSLQALAPLTGNGVWSVIGGSGIITDVNAASTSINSLGVGNNTFVWTVSNAICPAVSDTVIINVTPVPSNSAAGADLQICGTSIQLNANTPITGVGHWIKINNGSTISDTLSPQALVFNLNTGSNKFVWSIENGVCPANVDTVEIFTFQNSTSPIAGNDTTICQNEITLNANTIDIGIGQWGIVSSAGTFSDFNLKNTQITNLNEGENILVWTSVNGVCPMLSDTIIIQYQACPDTTVFIPQGFSPNNDGTNDVFIITGTGGKNVSVQIFNRWGSKVYENNNYQNDWGGTNEDSKELLDATYYYIIKVDGEAEARTGYITVWR